MERPHHIFKKVNIITEGTKDDIRENELGAIGITCNLGLRGH